MPLATSTYVVPTPPRVNFDWAPKSVALTLTVAGNTYPYSKQSDAITRVSDSRYSAFTTPTNQAITFTADATAYNEAIITEYIWDLGNGVRAYGATTSYTFTVPNPAQQVSLIVRDSNGLQSTAVQYMNLVLAYATVAKRAIRV